MGAKKGNARTAANKKRPQKIRMLDGKVVKPCWFDGRATNKGKYMAGEINEQLILNEKGIPLPYKSIGQSVYA